MIELSSGLLTVERLKGLSDSVLLVALTILAYNLVPPTLINNQLDQYELESFFDNLFGMVASFVVIFLFWIFYMKILDYLKEPNDIVILASLVFFVLILILPVFTLAQAQYENVLAVTTLSLLVIAIDLILIFIWKYIQKRSVIIQFDKKEIKSIHTIFFIILSLYTISIMVSVYDIKASVLFPVIMIPILLLLNNLVKLNRTVFLNRIYWPG